MNSYFIKSERIGFSVWNAGNIDLAFLLWGQPEFTKYISAVYLQTNK